MRAGEPKSMSLVTPFHRSDAPAGAQASCWTFVGEMRAKTDLTEVWGFISPNRSSDAAMQLRSCGQASTSGCRGGAAHLNPIAASSSSRHRNRRSNFESPLELRWIGSGLRSAIVVAAAPPQPPPSAVDGGEQKRPRGRPKRTAVPDEIDQSPEVVEEGAPDLPRVSERWVL